MWIKAACLDRISGGTTMVLHSSGTTVPGAPHRPEYLKAIGYLPPAFVQHNPQLHTSILQLVQLFIETIAVKTTNDWTARARSQLKWGLRQVGSPEPNPAVIGMPAPETNSAHYTFLGQCTGEHNEGTFNSGSPPSSVVTPVLSQIPATRQLRFSTFKRVFATFRVPILLLWKTFVELTEP